MNEIVFFICQDELNLNDVPLEGDITVPKSFEGEEDELSTLDEPVKDTIVMIFSLIFCVNVKVNLKKHSCC